MNVEERASIGRGRLRPRAATCPSACGGGGDKNDSAKQTSAKPAEADLLVSNPSEALGASAGKFEDQVDSVEGQFTIEMKIGEASFAADGTFAYKAPDSVHMTMNMS